MQVERIAVTGDILMGDKRLENLAAETRGAIVSDLETEVPPGNARALERQGSILRGPERVSTRR